MKLPILDPKATAMQLAVALPTIEAASLMIPVIGAEVVAGEKLIKAAIEDPVIGPFLIGVYNEAAQHWNANH